MFTLGEDISGGPYERSAVKSKEYWAVNKIIQQSKYKQEQHRYK